MFGRRFHLFHAFGIPIRADVSWFLIAILIAWSLASAFSTWVPGLTAASYWAMGAAGALGLFASILLHELGHALTARRYGVEMEGITLFIFGGVAEMRSEPPSARAEFWVALAGPAVSVLLCAVGLLSSLTLGGLEVSEHITQLDGSPIRALLLSSPAAPWVTATLAIIWWLGLTNGVLVLFNMIPAFPLDGGRVLRSILWAWKRDLRRATEITANLGSLFGLALIAFGVFRFINGDVMGGMWMGLIGWFLRQAAASSYQQLLLRRALEGEPVRRFMQPQAVTVEPTLSLADFVDSVVYRFHFNTYPVLDSGKLLGSVSTRKVRDIDRNLWPTTTVADIMDPADDSNSISPDADAMAALSRMNRTGRSRLLVTSNGRLHGILSLKDLVRFMATRVELEND